MKDEILNLDFSLLEAKTSQKFIDIYSYIAEQTTLSREEVKSKLFPFFYSVNKIPDPPKNPNLQDQKRYCDEIIELHLKEYKKPLNS